MLKKYLLLFIIFVSIFGCKHKNRVSYDGVLIRKNDLPFRGFYVFDTYIFLKTSIKDEVFPDGVRYYEVIPKDNNFQDLRNNLGKTIKIEGEEYVSKIEIPFFSIRLSEEEKKEGKPNLDIDYRYILSEAKIVKVY